MTVSSTILLRTKDLQKSLNIGRDKAYGLMHASGFPSIKIGGTYYVSQDELQKWLQKYTYKEFQL